MKPDDPTMTRNLHKMTRAELGRLFPVIISEPDSSWPKLYEEEKELLVELLGREIVTRVEHIGSTAVPGLAAKPTIDLLVEIPPGTEVEATIAKTLLTNGYHHMVEQKDHLMFVKGYTPEGFKGQCYHVHMARGDQEDFWRRLRFRDYLIANPQTAREYETLKRELAIRHRFDREAYTEAKSEFINRITGIAGRNRNPA